MMDALQSAIEFAHYNISPWMATGVVSTWLFGRTLMLKRRMRRMEATARDLESRIEADSRKVRAHTYELSEDEREGLLGEIMARLRAEAATALRQPPPKQDRAAVLEIFCNGESSPSRTYTFAKASDASNAYDEVSQNLVDEEEWFQFETDSGSAIFKLDSITHVSWRPIEAPPLPVHKRYDGSDASRQYSGNATAETICRANGAVDGRDCVSMAD